MKIVVKAKEDRDGHIVEELHIDGKERCCVRPLCECPEDAIIGRDLISCSEIAELMQEAFAAGAARENFDIVTEDSD